MPYPDNASLPEAAKSRFSGKCLDLWREVWNSTYGKTQDEGKASAFAYTAARKCAASRAGDASMTEPAVRTISETADVHVIEARLAYGGPFDGRDTYGTYFSARTDWGLDLHPDGIPVLFNHGFDPDFGLHPIGRTAPTKSFRADTDGLWVEMQLDKRNRYYATRVRPLLDSGALGASQGSAEHSLDIDSRTGEVRAWPLHEISLTPTESNPWNVVAARTAEVISIVEATRRDMDKNVGGGVDRDKLPAEDFAGPDRSFPIVTPGDVSDAASSLGRAKGDTASIKAKIIAIAKRKGAAFVAQLPKAWTEDDGARTAARSAAPRASLILADLTGLRALEADEPDQAACLDDAIAALLKYITLEVAEPQPDDEDDDDAGGAYMSGVRAGRRNSTTDQAHLDAAHQAAHDTIAHTSAAGANCDTCNSPEAEATEDAAEGDAARTADPLTTVRVVEREDASAVRADLLALASKVGEETARRLMR